MTKISLDVTPQLTNALQIACIAMRHHVQDIDTETALILDDACRELETLRLGLMAAEIQAARSRRANS